MNTTAFFVPVLSEIGAANDPHERRVAHWHLQRIDGGVHTILDRMRGVDGDFAVKWTLRDDRAGRTDAALRVLREVGLEIAPDAVWLERDHFPQPVLPPTSVDVTG